MISQRVTDAIAQFSPSNSAYTIIGFGVIGWLIFGAAMVVAPDSNFARAFSGRPGSEQEGTIKTEDCRAQVIISEGSPVTRGRQFMCTYAKSNSGKLMGGSCTAVDTEADGKTCKTSYTYQKKAWKTCRAHSTLGADDQCSPDPGYRWSPESNAFENNQCAQHSTLHGALCYPDMGYLWVPGKAVPVAVVDTPDPNGGWHSHEFFGMPPGYVLRQDRTVGPPDQE